MWRLPVLQLISLHNGISQLCPTHNAILRTMLRRIGVLGGLKRMRRKVYSMGNRRCCSGSGGPARNNFHEPGSKPEFQNLDPHTVEWRTKDIDNSWRKAHPRRNFFVVWTQHATEVFYRWYDAKLLCRSERKAKMKGFDTLQDAYAAARSAQLCED